MRHQDSDKARETTPCKATKPQFTVTTRGKLSAVSFQHFIDVLADTTGDAAIKRAAFAARRSFNAGRPPIDDARLLDEAENLIRRGDEPNAHSAFQYLISVNFPNAPISASKDGTTVDSHVKRLLRKYKVRRS